MANLQKDSGFSLYEAEKRLLDIIVSIIALIIFSPLFFVVAIAIKLDSKGPVFADIPKRVGRYGKPFFMFKFRSMYANSHQKLRTDPEFAALYEEYKANSYKILEDPRVTKVGKFIRKTSIDELPQFINVLKGEMSVVGSRPFYPDELKEQAAHYPQTRKFIKRALQTKPGVTGPWQVGGRSEVAFPKRIEMDAKYAETKSILYDIKIIIKTPFVILLGKGVY